MVFTVPQSPVYRCPVCQDFISLVGYEFHVNGCIIRKIRELEDSIRTLNNRLDKLQNREQPTGEQQ